jgi:hypothetical protein
MEFSGLFNSQALDLQPVGLGGSMLAIDMSDGMMCRSRFRFQRFASAGG